MMTLPVDDARTLAAATASLRAGDVIVVPTDTVYGVAARPDDAEAVRRIYLAKDRPDRQHLPVLAASLDQVRALGVEFPPAAAALASRWWPGPLTMVLGFSGTNPPPSWLADREEVAVRIPRNNFLLDLMRATGVLVVTSANRHGAATPASAGEAGAQLTPHVALVVDAGTLDVIPSTLVNLRGGQAVVEREGAISGAAIAEAIASAATTSAAMEVPT